MNKEILKKVLSAIVSSIEEEKNYLIELDGNMGDGDLGLTMYNGFSALYNEIDNLDCSDLGLATMKLGMKMNSVVPSTMGTLISICLIRGSKAFKGKSYITLNDIVNFGEYAVDGVVEVGKTKIGNKTMLDALYPAVKSLKESNSKGLSIKDAFEKAYLAASNGVEETITMKSVHGRAAYYGDKSIGNPDPGATAVKFIIKGIYNSLN